MSKFFIPDVEDPNLAERIWQATRDALAEQGLQTTPRRIQAIGYMHDGKECHDEEKGLPEDLQGVDTSYAEPSHAIDLPLELAKSLSGPQELLRCRDFLSDPNRVEDQKRVPDEREEEADQKRSQRDGDEDQAVE